MRPILIYDGECGFCRLWIARWKVFLRDKITFEPSQETSPKSIQFIDGDQERYEGALAVFKMLSLIPSKRWMLWGYRKILGLGFICERFYNLVASHRIAFSRLTRVFWGGNLEPSTYHTARFVFLKLLGLIYAIAFISLWTQILGLIGSNGILPIAPLLNLSDFFLEFLCGGGVLFSLLLLLGLAPSLSLGFLWLLYLFLMTVSRVFLSYQWDILLLETGFLAIFFAYGSKPSRPILFLLKLLLFKLMFSSGLVKWLADPNWRDFTALSYHYETQPLPTWIGWYAHQLPLWFQKISAMFMFGVEIFIPFLIFMPRRLRLNAFFAMVFLQILILLTGNYTFFNLLAIGLCLLLLDDFSWPRGFKKELQVKVEKSLSKWLVIPFSFVILLLTAVHMTGRFLPDIEWPGPIIQLARILSPFNLVNNYGLFARMTTSRPEIIVEGSLDGKDWKEYEFKWKPGDLKRRPRFVAPHQPRLDWQMWFAALSTYERTPWFHNFLLRLLQGSKEVSSLLGKDPFDGKPPQYVRTWVYDYHFTDIKTKRETEKWWRRELIGPYSPVLSLTSNSIGFRIAPLTKEDL